MGGLEPPQIAPHAPQACASTIPPHRRFNYINMVAKTYLKININKAAVSFEAAAFVKYKLFSVRKFFF